MRKDRHGAGGAITKELYTMEYTFCQDYGADKLELLSQYAQRLTGVTDDFWEQHILDAPMHRILADGVPAGWLTVYDGELATAMELAPEHRTHAREILARAISGLGVSSAFSPTCDEGWLTACLDIARTVEPQAYLFDGTTALPVRAPEYPRSCMRRIAPEEFAEVQRASGGFFTGDATCQSLAAGEQYIYALDQAGEALGWGIIVPLRSRPQYWACGMVTRADMLRRGIGRSIQLHLADICREQGRIPISGCWHKNHLSRKTIESAGRAMSSMLIKVEF